MRRLFSILIVLCFVSSFLFSQPAVEENRPSEIRVAALKGPTAMGLVRMMDTEGAYSFVLEGSPDAIVPKLAKGEVDIAAIPANLASVVYNNTKGVKVIAINTLGVLYLVGQGTDEIKSREDFLGKTIYSAGKGSTPQYALEGILSSLMLEDGKDVYVEYKSEHAECVAALQKDSSAIAMLPQPFASSALMQNPELSIILDMNDLWQSISGTPLITGCAVVKSEFAEKYPHEVEEFLKKYSESVLWVNENREEASLLIEKNGIIKAKVAEKALPYCNIVCITGEEMKKDLDEYLNSLFSQNPKSVGGSVPGEEFYF